MRIVHLSDFHIDANDEEYIMTFVKKSLLKDLDKQHEKTPIDMIAFTGDLVNKGGNSFESLVDAFQTAYYWIIEPLLNKLKLDHSKFFFVPGNHDLDLTVDNDITELGLTSKLIDSEAVFKYQKGSPLVGSDRIKAFKNFERDFYKDINSYQDLGDLHCAHNINVQELNIGIACLNSAWRCNGSEKDSHSLIIGEHQFISSYEVIKDCDIRICLFHHPTDCLIEFDKRSTEEFLTQNFQVSLTGHLHNPSVHSRIYSQQHTILISSAASNWAYNVRNSNTNFFNSYSIFDIHLHDLTIHQTARRYIKSRNEYTNDPEIVGDNEYNIFSFSIQTDQNKEDIKKIHELRDTYIESLNEDLIAFDSDSVAPMDIKRIFVPPKIVERPASGVESSDAEEKKLLINNLIESNDSFILFGQKEIGKTVLLDRLLIYFLEEFFKLGTVPVHFDFQNFPPNQRVETVISKFLNIGIRDLDSYLKNHRIVLLVDNLNFEDSKKYKLKKFSEFLKGHKLVRLIATSTTTIENQIPFNYINSQYLRDLRIAIIQSFRTDEIQKLTNNWFSSDIEEKTGKKRIDKVIKLLLALNLPRTPLAVSVFLWIMEKQENFKPINQATMIENFIEKLFDKHSDNEVNPSIFDYRNKERLLADIAEFMLENRDESYKVLSTKLIEFITKYLSNRGFEHVNAKQLYDHFVERRIITEMKDGNYDYVCFRFNCFIEYFLAKQMQFNPIFREFVLTKEQYLSFSEELDYFTGLQRDQIQILKKLTGWLNEDYKEGFKLMQELPLGYDTPFLITPDIVNEEKMVASIRENRENIQNEYKDATDKLLDEPPKKLRVVKKNFQLSPFQKLERSWLLVARILRNTEETEDYQLKQTAYRIVLSTSLFYAYISKNIIDTFLVNKTDNPENSELQELMEITGKVVPLIHQLAFHEAISSSKLITIFRKHMRKVLDDNSYSDIERFVAVFIYADSNGDDYWKYIKELLQKTRQKYLYDMILFKIFLYYMLNTQNVETDFDKKCLNMLADTIIVKRKLPHSQKGKIMDSFRTDKISHIKESNK